MKTYTPKILLCIISFLLSIISIFFCIETGYRIQKKGIVGAFKSYFIYEVPYSVLGVSNWIISDPTLGYRLNPDQPEINEYSMKEHPIAMPKPVGLKRVVVLGDSIPYGGNPNFVDILKTQFQNDPYVEILNASTPGYTTYQELLYLDQYLLKIDPDIVILSYCLNDNYIFLHRFDEEADMLFTDEAEQVLQINNSVDKFISQSYFLSNLKFSYESTMKKTDKKISKYWWDESVDFKTAWQDYSWPVFESQLNKMNNLLKKQDAKLLVVIFPLVTQLDPALLKKDSSYVLKPQRKVSSISKKHHIPYLDMHPLFFNATHSQQAALYTDGLHLSYQGHSLAAQAIYSFLRKNLYGEP